MAGLGWVEFEFPPTQTIQSFCDQWNSVHQRSLASMKNEPDIPTWKGIQFLFSVLNTETRKISVLVHLTKKIPFQESLSGMFCSDLGFFPQRFHIQKQSVCGGSEQPVQCSLFPMSVLPPREWCLEITFSPRSAHL